MTCHSLGKPTDSFNEAQVLSKINCFIKLVFRLKSRTLHGPTLSTPETEQSDYTNWPYSYVENHYVARVMQEIQSDGNGGAHRVWLVEGGLARSSLKIYLE